MNDNLLKQILDKLNVVAQEQQNMKFEMQDMKSEMQNMNNRLGSLETKTDQIIQDVTEVKGDIKRIDQATNDDIVTVLRIVEEKTSEINAKMDKLVLKGDLDYIDKKISEHDREIFKIKNRA